MPLQLLCLPSLQGNSLTQVQVGDVLKAGEYAIRDFRQHVVLQAGEATVRVSRNQCHTYTMLGVRKKACLIYWEFMGYGTSCRTYVILHQADSSCVLSIFCACAVPSAFGVQQ